MTKEEIMELGFDEIEKRASEIAVETADADGEMLEALNAELDAIAERRSVLEAEIETRKKAEAEIIKGKGETIEERKEEIKPMDNKEIRNSREYIEAFANYVKTGNDMECRALFSDNYNGQDSKVPVPDFVAEIVAEGIKESPILSRLRRMEAPGNVKVGFEASAPGAAIHQEGGGEVDEEELVLGIVTMNPVSLKKWVSISDEALDSMTGQAYLEYLYTEITRGIIKTRENAVVGEILGSPTTASATAPAVPAGSATAGTPALDDFVQARALLSSAASDLVIICTPAQYADYRALQLGAQYAVDPFDGLEVLFNDTVTVPIIGDLNGVMENLPKGEAVEFKYDDKTDMTSDMVRVLGRMPVAIAVVGNKYLATIGARS